MNKIALSPNSLVGVPALEYIDALVKAGYDGIGLRMYASPGVNYESVTQPLGGQPGPDARRQAALADSGLILYDILSYYIRPGSTSTACCPSLEFGAELGFPYALAIADDPDWGRQVDNFARSATRQNLGMTVSLEAPVGQNAVNTLPLALQLHRRRAGATTRSSAWIRSTSGGPATSRACSRVRTRAVSVHPARRRRRH